MRKITQVKCSRPNYDIKKCSAAVPLREAFFREKSMDITSEVKLTNHASSILQ